MSLLNSVFCAGDGCSQQPTLNFPLFQSTFTKTFLHPLEAFCLFVCFKSSKDSLTILFCPLSSPAPSQEVPQVSPGQKPGPQRWHFELHFFSSSEPSLRSGRQWQAEGGACSSLLPIAPGAESKPRPKKPGRGGDALKPRPHAPPPVTVAARRRA